MIGNAEETPDTELAALTSTGDVAALETLYRRLYGPTLGYALSLTRQRTTAEDLVSEAFLRTWDHLRNGTVPRNPKGYLCRAVHNLYIDQMRRETRNSDVDPTDEASHPAPLTPDVASEVVERDTLKAAAAALTPRQRAILWDTAVEGYSTAEAADRLGLDSANAGAQLAVRARRTLGRAYKKNSH